MTNDGLIALMLDSLSASDHDRRAILFGETTPTRNKITEFLLSFTTTALEGGFPTGQLQRYIKKAKAMSDNDCTIRAARLAERQRRNNPWSEPAVTKQRQTDTEILDAACTKRVLKALKPGVTLQEIITADRFDVI